MGQTGRVILVIAFFLGCCCGLGAVAGAKRYVRPQALGLSYFPELEKSIFRLTNEVRRKRGLAALKWERSLSLVARAHSVDMLQRGYFSHVDPEGRTPRERVLAGYPHPLSLAGENIWTGSGHDPGDTRLLARIIVDNWMSSPGHRQNLLNPDYTDIGVGVVGRGQEIRATQVLVRTVR